MTYKLEIHERVFKYIKKMPKKTRTSLLEKIDALQENPRPPGSKKLKGKNIPFYRIRHGDYRIVYSIKDKALYILVIAIGHRKEIYEKSF